MPMPADQPMLPDDERSFQLASASHAPSVNTVPDTSNSQPAPSPAVSRTPKDPAALRAREIEGEQLLLDLAYSELDHQLAEARRALEATHARGGAGTHQSRGERDAYAAHYAGLVSTLEGVEDRLVFGRMDLSEPPGSPVTANASTPDLTTSHESAPVTTSATASSPSPSAVTNGGLRHYVGRIGLQDAKHREIVLDWRAPLARAFYQGTASHPMGLTRRRHIDTRARKVVGIEDELLDVAALGRSAADAEAGESSSVTIEGLQGEGALIAAMSAARDGRMGDIVSTIQGEQDRIVTADGKGILVVQGGPGTGKTAVALHRVAYLFYSERARLERSGVLLVGPSRTFLRYVEQVLPSLGESRVVSVTLGDLVPGIRARGSESPRLHELKGQGIWATILSRAVKGLQRVPQEPRSIIVQGTKLQLTPEDVREAMNRARRSGKPHNQARETFVLWLLERLTDQYASLTRQDASDEDTRAWIREDIRTARDARREINLCWMPTTPQGLLETLYARPERLARYAPELTEEERALLIRERGAELTPADIPLIDELAELLGPAVDAAAREARLAAQRRAELISYAQQAIESQDLGDGMVSAEMLADRVEDTGPLLTLAERARADRSWTYGHVVVDEAQELGDMAWRALARRCPVRSFTVVGDLAQYAGPQAPASWGEVLRALGTGASTSSTHTATPGRAALSAASARGAGSRASMRGRNRRAATPTTPLREEVLTVCYRTPATIMDIADAVVTALGHPPVYPVSSVRDLPNSLLATDLSDLSDDELAASLRSLVTQELTSLTAELGEGAGRLAVIAPDPQELASLLSRDSLLTEAMHAPEGDVLRARLAVMGPGLSKGLEFDAVVLLDPSILAQRSVGDLYVAMTRPTRRLHIVSRVPLPAEIEQLINEH